MMMNLAKAHRVCAIIVIGLVLAIAYHASMGLILGAGYPTNTFLYDPLVRFDDFYQILDPVRAGSPVAHKEAVYFPFAYAPLFPLVGLPRAVALAATITLFVGSVLLFCWQELSPLPRGGRAITTAVLGLLSYPVLFVIDRANLEMFVAIFVLAFLACFARRQYGWAAVFLAGATAMKAYPAVFGVLFLVRRQWLAAAFSALLAVALTLGMAAAFPGGVTHTITTLVANQQFFRHDFIFNPSRANFSTSYWSLVKLVARMRSADPRSVLEHVHAAYVVASLLLFVALASFILLRERVFWKQVALLTFAMVLLPEVSFDYRLVHLLAPAVLFIAASPCRGRDDAVYATLFGLLLIPKAYAPIGTATTLGVILNPALMTLFIAHIIWRGLRLQRPHDDRLPTAA